MVSAAASNPEFVDTTSHAAATNDYQEWLRDWMQKVKARWQGMSFHEQGIVLASNKVPIGLIELIWPGLVGVQRDIVSRRMDLPTAFIWRHWAEFTDEQKEHCFLHQNPLDVMPLEQLPQFLSSPIAAIRKAAIERYNQINND